MTAEKSHVRTQYEIWAHHLQTGELMPTGVLDDAAFAAQRYDSHVKLGTRPILRTRTVTTTYSEWTDVVGPATADTPLVMPADPPAGELTTPLFDLDENQ